MEHYVAQKKPRKKLPPYRQTAHKSGPLVAHTDFSDIDLCKSSFRRKLISLQFFGWQKRCTKHADLLKTCSIESLADME